jgi:hypothetical protein
LLADVVETTNRFISASLPAALTLLVEPGKLVLPEEFHFYPAHRRASSVILRVGPHFSAVRR